MEDVKLWIIIIIIIFCIITITIIFRFHNGHFEQKATVPPITTVIIMWCVCVYEG